MDSVLAVLESAVDIKREESVSSGVAIKLAIEVSVDGTLGVDGVFDFFDFDFAIFLEDSLGIAFKSSAGISVKLVAILPKLPIIAAAPPVMGSLGPGSVSYSLGRYLEKRNISTPLPNTAEGETVTFSGHPGPRVQLHLKSSQQMHLA